uniref:TIR domain-containing protein n=1 Tax=Ciona savignyi TaxID=51511 RepID=H2Z5X3_CIOSA
MIIILTEDYIKDRWARFEAEQGLINMMNSRTKLIFITTKGVNKAMRNSMNFPRGLSDALKVARTIKWKPSMDEKQFQAAVACALPNLQPRNSAEDTQLTTV